VQNVQIIAFAIQNNGSQRITESQMLPGLAINLLQSALQRTSQMNQSQVIAYPNFSQDNNLSYNS